MTSDPSSIPISNRVSSFWRIRTEICSAWFRQRPTAWGRLSDPASVLSDHRQSHPQALIRVQGMDVPTVPLWSNFDFIRLLLAQGLSITGREIGTIVLPLLVLAITGSPAQVGFIAAAQAIPYLLLSLPAGALVDRWDRRGVMLICEYVRVLALLSLPTVWLIHDLYLIHLYVVAVTTGVAFVFYSVAEISALPQLVTRPQLSRATSSTNVVEWAGELSGPALGGFLVGAAKTTVAGAMLAYLIQGVMQLLSAISLMSIRRNLAVQQTGERPGLLREVREGAHWLWRQRVVRALAALALTLNFLFGPVTIAIIVLASNEFQTRPEAIGLLFSVAGAVGLITAVVAPVIHRVCRTGSLIVGSTFLWALGMLLMPMADSIMLLGLGWAIVTAVGGIYDVVATSYRLALIPESMQGRVNSVFRFIGFGMRPVTLAAGGYLIATIGARDTLWILALGMVATALGTVFSPLRTTGPPN